MEYQIGQFSKITSLSIKTLHHYDEIKLLRPCRIDAETNYRFYSEDQIELATIIQKLKKFEFPLNEIREIVENYEDDADINNYLKNRAEKINESYKKYQKLSKEIQFSIALNKDENLGYSDSIVIKKIDTLRVISIRYSGKYSDIGKYFGKLFKAAGRNICGKPFALYHDADYKNVADIQVCIPVKKLIKKEGIECHELLGGSAYCLIHKGPYEALSNSYKKVIDYIQKNNIETCRPSREIYIKSTGIFFKGNPEKYITEIQFI